MKTIEVIVTTEGEVRAQTRGFSGRACLAASRFLEAALGRTVSARLSNEFFTVSAVHDQELIASQHHPG
jgi:hypothetical protein